MQKPEMFLFTLLQHFQERDSYKYKLWRLVESTPFEYFIMTLIVLNTVLLMMKVIITPWFVQYYDKANEV